MHRSIDYDIEQHSTGCCMFAREPQSQKKEVLINQNFIQPNTEKVSLKKTLSTTIKSSHFQQTVHRPIQNAPVYQIPSNSHIVHQITRQPSSFHDYRMSLPQQFHQNVYSINRMSRQSSLSSVNRKSFGNYQQIRQQSAAFTNKAMGNVNLKSYENKNHFQLASQRQILANTTKLTSHLEQQNDVYMKKTKKQQISPSRKVTSPRQLMNFKASVYSVVSEEDQRFSKANKLEESQIIVDYFHPSTEKLKEIEILIGKQKRSDSTFKQ